MCLPSPCPKESHYSAGCQIAPYDGVHTMAKTGSGGGGSTRGRERRGGLVPQAAVRPPVCAHRRLSVSGRTNLWNRSNMIYSRFGSKLTLISKGEDSDGQLSVQATCEGMEGVRA